MYIHIYTYTYVWRWLSNWPSDSQISGPQCSNFLTVLERYGLEIALVQVQGICSLFLDICTDLAGALIFLSGSDSTIFTVSDSSISETVSFQVHSWRFCYVGRFKFIEFWASKFMELGSYGSYMLQCLRFGVYMLLCLKVHRFWGIYKYNIMFKHFFPSMLNVFGFKIELLRLQIPGWHFDLEPKGLSLARAIRMKIWIFKCFHGGFSKLRSGKKRS